MKKKTAIGIAAAAGVVGAITGTKVLNEVKFRIAFDPKFKFPNEPDLGDIEEEIQQGIEFIKQKNIRHLEIVNENGSKLSAVFVPAKDKSNKYVILSHGYRNNGLHEFGLFFPFYYEQNVNLLVVNHQAHGDSEGKYITFGDREHVDILQWIDYLNAKYGKHIQIYLHGVSMGSATVLMTMDQLPENVKGVIADCGYANAKNQLVHTMKLNKVPFKKATYQLINLKLRRRYDSNMNDVNILKAVENTNVPLKIIHGAKDDFVPVQNSELIYDACGSKDKELIIIENAGHAQSYHYDKSRYEKAIMEILSKE